MGVKIVTTTNPAQEQVGSTLSIKAQEASVGYSARVITLEAPPLRFDLLPTVVGAIVPGSLVFTYGGKTYIERSGIVYTDVSTTTNAGIAVGTIDYDSKKVSLTSYPPATAANMVLLACLVAAPGFAVTYSFFRTAGAPIRPGSLQITAVEADTGTIHTATSTLNGEINNGIIHGSVDHQTGVVVLRFTTDVDDESGGSEVGVLPNLLRYNAVVQTLLPLDADLIGLDPVRLPADGRVPIFRAGDVAVLHNTIETEVFSPVAGGSIALTRGEVSFVEVMDVDGKVLPTTQYTVDNELGILTWANPLILQDEEANALSLPLTIRDRVEHMALITEAQITGSVTLSSEVPWSMGAEGTYLSSAVTWGDLQARLFNWFTQQTWSSNSPNWTDSVVGGSTTAQYNSLAYPPLIANMGAIEGKWALVFTSSTTFQVVEEKLGIITTGNVSTDCSPINPLTNTPYFTIPKEGWGIGWASGNAVRFKTSACLGPMWVVRTVLSGKGTVDDDNFKIQIRGDAD